jgi:glucose/mannose-6-phosphate isomerase
MNHHLVEAFENPCLLKKRFCYIFFISSQYYSRVKIRYKITQQILKRQNIDTLEYQLKSKDRFSQVLELIQLGGLVSIYLSLLNNQDPGPEPWIIYLKKRLKTARNE